MKPDSREHRAWRVWPAPIALAVVIMAGLLSALLGDLLAWKTVGWVCLFIPVVTAGWFALRRRRS
jgi:hypothetical protein